MTGSVPRLPGDGEPRLRVEAVSKTFGSNRALREVELDVVPGEIHGLVGQNGSGKSTLAKVLTGYHGPDPGGRVFVDGAPLRLPVRPLEARARGLTVVHQSLGLVNDRTVVENLRLGRFRARRMSRRIHWREERDAARAALERLGLDVPLEVKVGALNEEDRATVAIARALQDAQDGTGVIIFDESTRSLTRESLEHFYKLLDSVVATGTSVLLITHRLEEVLDATDRVTVLRDGVSVECGLPTKGLSEADLVRTLLGRELLGLAREKHTAPAETGQPVRIEGLSGQVARDVDVSVAPGEIVGVTGIAGSGHDEVPYLVSGVRKATAGRMWLGGKELALSKMDAAAAIAAGVALVPEGREREGLALEMTVAENVLLADRSCRRGAMAPRRRRAERALVGQWIERLDVRPPAGDLPAGKLSGGNQQKVLLAKWLATNPDLLVLHEPTQAVDVGARHAIVAAVRAAADAGCAVLVSSSDENELSLLCDRVVIFRDGAAQPDPLDHPSADDIVQAIYSGGKRRLRA
ncbi:sugar ABC transporter ATP-binding protein [Amycolatopsis acidicola]|uniref:Sugar ABC transporter ATP-binding protein n=1 Tax=Amycolatopsis acidicola TaxID=2596893 RepID=A0A5N0UYJ7_9PSEU|nr:sugar ABC transporter ATP-binding protein [Amycolatopsis acidicola]KAA9158714.1 sugar ABC transporter ATP-binding protein [Amycolatopsis acidicola]